MPTSKETSTVKGVHTITICDVSSPEAKKLERRIELVVSMRQFLMKMGYATQKRLHKNWTLYRELIAELHSKFKVREMVIENITTTVGRSVLAQRLSGTTTYTGIVNYTAIGTDATAPVVGDATLGTETYRKALSSGTYSNNIAYLETFFSAAEVNGTFEEYGMFIDGGAGADTGQLFNRFVETNVKTALETMNVQSIITINDA